MLFFTSGNQSPLATVDALSLRRQAAIAPDLLIMAETVTLGNWDIIASFAIAVGTSLIIFALGGQAAMPPDLLVVPRAIATGTRSIPTSFCLTNQAPFT